MTDQPDTSNAATPSSSGTNSGSTTKPKRKTRKELKEEVQRLQMREPDTLWDAVKFPLILAIIFAISLLVFHHAPHDKSKREGFKLPQSRAPLQEGGVPPPKTQEVPKGEPEL
mmetsp:Transcript_22645/g.63145  ORF Transcript_22645/g.63145 Transcript_22645/m.63145 type:complete len:113 (+) Transcript_22645:317-655(+)